MIPMGRLSTVPMPAAFQSPDDLEIPDYLTDFELGGVALSDPSGGLRDRIWTARADGTTGEVFISAPGVFETVLFTAPGITELSLTFDQNMRPFVAFVQDGQAKYFWYDTVLGETRISNLGATDRNPRCCLDDKRPYQTAQGSSDVILAYLRGTALYYRQQRDRYENEYLLKDPVEGTQLIKVGMNEIWRLQFELQ